MPVFLESFPIPLLEAIAFAARAHRPQLRKDNQTPYVSHVFRVCMVVRHMFGIDDPQVLTAAVLHDTIEDTTTDYDDVKEHFGPEVADWVALLSKDKRLPEEVREEKYKAGLANAPWQVQVCKLADIFDNLLDSSQTESTQLARTIQRSREYLYALKSNLRPEAESAWKKVAELHKQSEGAGPAA